MFFVFFSFRTKLKKQSACGEGEKSEKGKSKWLGAPKKKVVGYRFPGALLD